MVRLAVLIALPPAIVSGMLTYLEVFSDGILDDFASEWNIKGSAFTSFTGLLGILIVFRTAQAYSRYWDGLGLLQTIAGNLFDAAASVMSYTVSSAIPTQQSNAKAHKERVLEFRQTLVALTSLLNAVCLVELFDPEKREEAASNVMPSVEIIGWGNFSEGIKRAVQAEKKKAHLVFFWWQTYVIRAVEEKVLDLPMPMLARAFGEMGSGLGNFESCVKLSRVPFPPSYTQIALWLLRLHWLLTPLVVMGWSKRPSLVFVFSFVLVFVFWGLYLTSVEFENPFGDDDNDVDMKGMQRYSNDCLQMLLSPATDEVVEFTAAAKGGRGDLRARGADVLLSSGRAVASECSSDSEEEELSVKAGRYAYRTGRPSADKI